MTSLPAPVPLARRAVAAVLVTLIVAAGQAGVPRPASAATELQILSLSNRADLLSGGDALIELVLPDGADLASVQVDVDGRDVTQSFAARDGAMGGRIVGKVTGLAVGANVLTARLPDGSGARLTLTNHPTGGPIISGPHREPWVCTTEENGMGPALDEDCNAPTIFELSYKEATTGRFSAYDPENPPAESAIATTTTDTGETVPFIVQVERGTLARGIYEIAVLFDPMQPWEPWAPQRGWNHKLSFLFGAACNPGHSQASAVDARDERMLSKGFAVAASSANVFGNVCNLTVAAESVMMISERLVEGYGELRYTIGNGCSGGSEAQHSIAENFPGLLDGILPQCSFADAWTPAILDKFDCPLFTRYFTQVSPHLWADPTDRQAVLGGNLNESLCAEQEAFAAAVWDPTTGCDLPAEDTYHPETNREGARCTLQDYNVAALGRRESDGFANGINDHVGRQWGLAALQSGRITTAQFVDLNEKLGGFDIDFNFQPERTVGDIAGIEAMYTTGQLTFGRNLAKVPSIDVRTDDTYDFHSNAHRQILRARMDRNAGGHEAQVLWFETQPGAFGMPTPVMAQRAFDLLDVWLTAIDADTSDDPLEEKVVRAKPEEAADGCFTGGQRVNNSAICEAAHSDNVMPRIVAGEPLSADVLKCALKPLDQADYRAFNIVFTAEEWARLEAAFPDGVCDFTKPGVGQQAPIAGEGWATLQDGPGGRALPAPPVSEPFGPPGAGAGDVRRVSGPHRIATAIALAGEAFPDGANAAVLARADDFADALAASSLAAELNAPVLLTENNALAPAVADELRRLEATEVYLVGGPAALDEGVADDTRRVGLNVVRVSGPTRFATATAIAEFVVEFGGAVEQVIVALGEAPAGRDAWPDALAASNLAAAGRAPILLTRADDVPFETAEALTYLAPDARVWIVGGPAAVGADAEEQLVSAGYDVQRLAGPDRYATASAVAAEAVRQGAQHSPVVLASGESFADALAAGPAAAALGGVLLLVDPVDLERSTATHDLLREHRQVIELVLLAGGPAAIADSVVEQVRAALAPTAVVT